MSEKQLFADVPVPEVYQRVTEGVVQEGDLLYSPNLDRWVPADFRLMIHTAVVDFAGVARPRPPAGPADAVGPVGHQDPVGEPEPPPTPPLGYDVVTEGEVREGDLRYVEFLYMWVPIDIGRLSVTAVAGFDAVARPRPPARPVGTVGHDDPPVEPAPPPEPQGGYAGPVPYVGPVPKGYRLVTEGEVQEADYYLRDWRNPGSLIYGWDGCGLGMTGWLLPLADGAPVIRHNGL